MDGRILRFLVWGEGVALLAVIGYLVYPTGDAAPTRVAKHAFERWGVHLLDCRAVDPGPDANGLKTYHCLLPHAAPQLEAAPQTEAGAPLPPRRYPKGVCFYVSPGGEIHFPSITQPHVRANAPCGVPSGP